MSHPLADYARTEKAIVVVFGLGVMVYFPTRRSPSLHFVDKSRFVCCDCEPASEHEFAEYGEHLQTHTRRKRPFEVVGVTPDGKMYHWPKVLVE